MYCKTSTFCESFLTTILLHNSFQKWNALTDCLDDGVLHNLLVAVFGTCVEVGTTCRSPLHVTCFKLNTESQVLQQSVKDFQHRGPCEWSPRWAEALSQHEAAQQPSSPSTEISGHVPSSRKYLIIYELTRSLKKWELPTKQSLLVIPANTYWHLWVTRCLNLWSKLHTMCVCIQRLPKTFHLPNLVTQCILGQHLIWLLGQNP